MLSGDDQLSESSPVADVAADVPAPMTNSKKPDAPITCPKCASVKAFATRGNLNRHIREKHQSVYQDMFSKGQVHPRPKTIQQLMNLYQTNSQVFSAGSNNYLQIFCLLLIIYYVHRWYIFLFSRKWSKSNGFG